MKKNILEIRDFVKSLENGVLSQKQEAVLLVGESENTGLGNNDGICGDSTNLSECNNNRCPNSTNYDKWSNIKYCAGAKDGGTSTGGGTGGGHGTSGAPGIDAGLMGFPGFNF